MNTKGIVFIDIEGEVGSKKILDLGAITNDGREFHSKDCPYQCTA